MKSLEEIRKEAEDECLRDNCQSWPTICIIAMEKALEEYRSEIIDNLEDKDFR